MSVSLHNDADYLATPPRIVAGKEPDMSALDTQIGGDHYKGMAIQPAEYIVKNGIGFLEGMVIKYVSRWEKKGGIEDLEKAIHCLQLRVEMAKQGTKVIPVGEVTEWGGLGE